MSTQAAELSVIDRLYELSGTIVAGATLEESLDCIFESFQNLIPYDRIGYADIDGDSQTATARWARSNDRLVLRNGFTAPLAGSSLSIVIQRRQPRILNNLLEYQKLRPDSRATKLIILEGIRSSMTCPLFVGDKPLGFLFFSSREFDAYTESHLKVMKEIAMHLALLLMASQHTVTTEAPPQCEADPEQEPQEEQGPRELPLSQLRPGMVLAKPIRVGGGTLLLAADTQFTQQSIDRLISLHQRGFMEIAFVSIR